MKYYIIAGEASGDLHASNMMKGLKEFDSQAQFRAWGGDLMKEQGATIVKHYRDLAFMGFVEVAKNIRAISKNFKLCKADLIEYKPDVLILVDYPGFNLRMAKFAKKQGIKVFYYISPTIWAWHQSRVYDIKKYVDKMFVILPFEKDFYKKFDCDVDFTGHPLLDAIEDKLQIKEPFEEFTKRNSLSDKPIIAILAGSRKQEISRCLPIMLEAAKHYEDYQFVIAAAPSIDEEYYQQFTQGYDAKILYGMTYDILQQSTAAMVTSGTATLETALFGVPEVVCYKAGGLTYAIGKRLVNVKYISLVNLIMDKEVVKELIQHDLNSENIKQELDNILFNTTYHKQILDTYKELRAKLGNRGASRRVAELMHKYLSE